MKNSIGIICLLIATSIYSQESTLDKIAKLTCEYLQKDEIAKLGNSDKTIKLGGFIIALYGEYKEVLKAEGIEIDFTDENAGRVFGEKVGLLMASYCPEPLIALAAKDEITDEVEKVNTFVGKIKAVTGNDFSFIIAEDQNGITKKFLWFSNFKGSEKLMSLDSAIGFSVKISYKNTECFSPKLNEYIIRKEIVEIEYLN